MNKVRSVIRSIDLISKWSGKILSYLLVFMMAVLLYEVVMRYFFDSPTNWAHELTQLTFGMYAIMLGAYASFHRVHVNMDILYSRWSPKTKAIADLMTSILLFIWCGTLLWFGSVFAAKSMSYWEHANSSFGPPIWEIKLMIPLAALLVLLQGLGQFVRNLYMVIRGKNL